MSIHCVCLTRTYASLDNGLSRINIIFAWTIKVKECTLYKWKSCLVNVELLLNYFHPIIKFILSLFRNMKTFHEYTEEIFMEWTFMTVSNLSEANNDLSEPMGGLSKASEVFSGQ